MVESKAHRYPEENDSKGSYDEIKWQAPKTKRYRGNKTWTNNQGPELKADTDFKGWCTNLEGDVFDIGPRALDNVWQETEGTGTVSGRDVIQ